MAGDGGPIRHGWLHGGITLLLAVAAGWSQFQLNRAEGELTRIQARLEVRESQRRDSEESRADRESRERKQFTVFDAVLKSVEANDPRRQAIAGVLVTSMLDIDDPLRSELLSVLRETATPFVQRAVQEVIARENAFRADETAVARARAAHPARWTEYDFDVFWCERSGAAARALAERLVAALQAEGVTGRVRLRLLPDTINARPAYQVSGHVVRYNSGEERPGAEVKRLGDELLARRESFKLALRSQRSEAYLPVYVCPNPT